MPFQKMPKICPICLEEKQFKFIQDYQNQYNKFSLFECSSCQTQFWMPFKSLGTKWYEYHYQKDNEYKLRDILRPGIYRDYHKKFLKLYKDFPKNTKVLDLGCGRGEFLSEIQKRGWKVWGIDFDRNAIEIAKKKFNLENVYSISFDIFFQKADLPHFDIVVFFEIIEHLDNPLKFIYNVKKILKPGGKIILSTPCRERFLADLAGWDFPPHHLTRWNEEAISNLFQKINFKVDNIIYVEQFKFLLAAINEKFRLGLVKKIANISKSTGKTTIFTKIIYFGACLKEYILGTIPAAFLWIISKMTKHNNGDMLIELSSK